MRQIVTQEDIWEIVSPNVRKNTRIMLMKMYLNVHPNIDIEEDEVFIIRRHPRLVGWLFKRIVGYYYTVTTNKNKFTEIFDVLDVLEYVVETEL